MKVIFIKLLFILQFLIISLSLYSQDDSHDWWNKKHNWDGISPWYSYLTYSAAYFGPNALPVPEIRDARIDSIMSLEGSVDLHFSSGDNTQNLFLKFRYPFFGGRVAIELFGVPVEHYKMDTITRDERAARCYDCEGTAMGDLYISTIIQLLRDKGAWPDLVLGFTLRTASGNLLGDARFTDAPGYYFDLAAGKSYELSQRFKIRPYMMLGFYVYQTNLDNFHQNDAFLYGIGISAYSSSYEFNAKWGGYKGYINNGDAPMVIRANAIYKLRKIHLKLGLQQGLNDFKYTSIRLGSIFYF